MTRLKTMADVCQLDLITNNKPRIVRKLLEFFLEPSHKVAAVHSDEGVLERNLAKENSKSQSHGRFGASNCERINKFEDKKRPPSVRSKLDFEPN